MLQNPPARQTLSVAAVGEGVGTSPGNRSSSLQLLLSPLPPAPAFVLAPLQVEEKMSPLVLGPERALAPVWRGQILTLLVLESASGQEHSSRFTWLLMLLCKQHVNELKCLIHNENISCFFNLLDMEIFFETENAVGRI